MIDLYVLDKDTEASGQRRDWKKLTGRNDLSGVLLNGTRLTRLNGEELPENSFGVVLIHTAYLDNKQDVPLISANYPRLALILLSAGGLPDWPRGERYWSVGHPVDRSRNDAFGERLRDFLHKYEKTLEPAFRILEPNVEPMLAFRILCEAWIATGGDPEGEMNGISIHAPQDAEDWRSPFRKDGQTDLPLPDEVAILMGDAEISEKAKAVLEAADPARKGDLGKAVKAFLEATKR